MHVAKKNALSKWRLRPAVPLRCCGGGGNSTAPPTVTTNPGVLLHAQLHWVHSASVDSELSVVVDLCTVVVVVGIK